MSLRHAEAMIKALQELNYEMEQRVSELAMDVRALGFEGVTVPPNIQGNTAVLVRQQGMIVALTQAINSLGTTMTDLLVEQTKAQLNSVEAEDDKDGNPVS